ncbi:hypothetical protein H2204_000705 [Knufia peltigerae]|uniref:Uncharacterized protein n=1 Tax=Knufia peltigerae TaxID=1002370 RepID=A0AA38YDZ2_9EURO|nr:hypothetical protein H2204_000705 [Knufia peltigerae]
MSTPSLLEYARFHGLAIDHGQKDPFAYLDALEPECDLVEVDAALSDPTFPSYKASIHEPKLQLGRDASQILSESIKDPCPDISGQYLFPKFHRLKSLKLEEPLLSTDHAFDVWNFKRSAAAGLGLKSLLVQAETSGIAGRDQAAEEWDNALFGRSYERFSDQDTRQAESYPLMHSSLLPSPSPPSLPKHNSRLEDTDELDIGKPQLEVDEYLDTDAATIVSAEHHAISQIEELPIDTSPKMQEQSGDSATLLKVGIRAPRNVSQDSVDNTRVIRPQPFDISSPALSVHLKLRTQAQSLKACIPDLQPTRYQLAETCTMQGDILEDLFSKSQLHTLFATTLEENNLSNWHQFDTAEFQDILRESINDAGRLPEIMASSPNIMPSEKMLWKRPGLVLLDSEDFSDVQMDIDNDLRQDVSAEPLPQVPQKRCAPGAKLDIQSSRKKQLSNSGKTPTMPPRGSFQPNRGRLKELIASQLRSPASNVSVVAQKESKPHGTSRFSAAKSLSTFLDLRGSKFKRAIFSENANQQQLSDDPIQCTPSEGSDIIRISPHNDTKVASQRQVQMILSPLAMASMTNMCLKNDILALEKFDPPKSIVINTEMLRKDRCLMASLETNAEGSLSMIYRDMDSPDIILNPRSCLIFTNLQSLNQRNLPGQYGSAGEGLVQSIVSRLAPEYEIIFVLVVVPDTDGCVSTNTQDIMAIFAEFCVSKSDRHTEARPIWISTNMDSSTMSDNLQSWVWTLIHQYGLPIPQPSQLSAVIPDNLSLIHDETIGEKFLRKAGLNPMAAQVALHVLKRQKATFGQVSESVGLKELAHLETEGRMNWLRDVLGPKMVTKMNLAFETQ